MVYIKTYIFNISTNNVVLLTMVPLNSSSRCFVRVCNRSAASKGTPWLEFSATVIISWVAKVNQPTDLAGSTFPASQ